MRSFMLFIALAYFPLTVASQTLLLSTYLKTDIKGIEYDHGIFAQNTKGTQHRYFLKDVMRDLQQFKVIAKTNLQSYKMSKIKNGDFELIHWKNATGNVRTIYQLTMRTNVDTVIDSTPLKNKFVYCYFLIKLAKAPFTLTYLTEKNQGLRQYKVGKKEVAVIYEDVLLEPPALTQKFQHAISYMIRDK